LQSYFLSVCDDVLKNHIQTSGSFLYMLAAQSASDDNAISSTLALFSGAEDRFTITDVELPSVL